MVNYRREYIAHSQVFLTVTLKNRQQDYLTRYIAELRLAVRYAQQRAPFNIISVCVLPDHLHLIMQLPLDCGDFSHRVRLLKSYFSRLLAAKMPLVKNKRGEYDIWQRRFWEHTIRDEVDLQRCVDYVHYNPVKHGLVTQVKDWPFSSFHGAVKQGHMSIDWGGEGAVNDEHWGER